MFVENCILWLTLVLKKLIFNDQTVHYNRQTITMYKIRYLTMNEASSHSSELPQNWNSAHGVAISEFQVDEYTDDLSRNLSHSWVTRGNVTIENKPECSSLISLNITIHLFLPQNIQRNELLSTCLLGKIIISPHTKFSRYTGITPVVGRSVPRCVPTIQ